MSDLIISILFFFLVLFIAYKFLPSDDKKKGKPVGRQLKDVKPGEFIIVKFEKAVGKFANPKCLNNDPKNKKILIEFTWDNYKEANYPHHKERFIWKYSCAELKDFSLLNPLHNTDTEPVDETNIASLQKRLNQALEKEEYEKADELQKKIDRLLKK